MEREIKILHLYSQTMDLYGDSLNLTAITKATISMGHTCTIDYVEFGDDINVLPYDLVYIGHGKAGNLCAIANHFIKHKEHINQSINDGKLFFVTGNARELFGKAFETPRGISQEGVGLFDYIAEELGEVIVSDEVAHAVFDENLRTYGFINRTAHLIGENHYPLFTLEKGLSDGRDPDGFEGTLYKNFFGTWQMGPLLARNPSILKEILKRMLKEDYQEIDTSLEEMALQRTLDEFNK